jgi:hypothetical protein
MRRVTKLAGGFTSAPCGELRTPLAEQQIKVPTRPQPLKSFTR